MQEYLYPEKDKGLSIQIPAYFGTIMTNFNAFCRFFAGKVYFRFEQTMPAVLFIEQPDGMAVGSGNGQD